MTNTLNERYSQLVDAKLRSTLVTQDNYIFNTNHEGNAAAGAVKIPVRDTEVEVKAYDKANGAALSSGATTYITMLMSNDEAVNELIDGYDAASLPDDVVAERLASAGYTLALSMDKKSIAALEQTEGVTVSDVTTAADISNAYSCVAKARTALSRMGVPAADRWLIASPEFMEIIMQDEKFIRQGDLSQELLEAGAVGRIAGFNVFESSNLMYGSTDFIDGKTVTTEFVCGHPNWCHRVQEWAVPVGVNPISDGVHIGASAVQGRKVYNVLVSKPETVYVKRTEA
ncbi:MAG: hypothetical protein IJF18_00735 [Oscillospiraceae bacterium]|nr:hypothetical protein [Oscillospiraceae bacterium]